MPEDPQKPRNHLRAVPPPPEDTPPADPPGEAFGSPVRDSRPHAYDEDDPATGEIPKTTGTSLPFVRRTGESGIPVIGDPTRVASRPDGPTPPADPEPPAEQAPPAARNSGPDESDPFGAMLRDLDKQPPAEPAPGADGAAADPSKTGDPTDVDPATTRLRESASELPRRIPKSSTRQSATPSSPPSDRPGWFDTPSSQPRKPPTPEGPPGQLRPPALFGAPTSEGPPEGRSDFRDFTRPDAPGRGGGPVPHTPSDRHAPGANGVSPIADGPARRPDQGPGTGQGFDAFGAHRPPQPPANPGPAWPAAGPEWPGMPEPPAFGGPGPQWPGAESPSGPQRSGAEPFGGAQWPGAEPPAAPQRPGPDPKSGPQWPGAESPSGPQRPGSAPPSGPAWPGAESSTGPQWPGVESTSGPQRFGAEPSRGPQWPGVESSGPQRFGAEPGGGAQRPGPDPQGGPQWPGMESSTGPQWPGVESPSGPQMPGPEASGGPQWPGAESRSDAPWPEAAPTAKWPGTEGQPPESRQESSGLTAPGSAWSTPSEGTAWPPNTPEPPGPHGHVPRGSERWRGPADANQPPQGPWNPQAAQPQEGPEGTAVLFQPHANGAPSGGGDPWQAQSGWQQNSGPWQGTTQPGWAQPPGPPTRNKWLWPLIAAVVVLVVAGGTFVFFQTTGGEETPQTAPPPKTGASPEASGAAPPAAGDDPKGTDFDVCSMLDPEQTERLVPAAKIDMRMSDERDSTLVSYVRWTCEWTNRNISYGEYNRQRQITVNVARYEAIGDTTADKAATIQFDGEKRQYDYTASVSNDERYYSKPQVFTGIGEAAVAQYQWTREDDYRYAFGTGMGRVGNITFDVKYEASQQHKEADVLTNDTKQSITEENAIREVKALLTQLAQSAEAWYAKKPLPFAGKARPTPTPTPSPSPVKIALPPNCVTMNPVAARLVPKTEGLAQQLTEGKAKLTECQWWNDAMPVEGGKVRWRNLRIGIREFPNAEMARFYLVDERGKSRGTAGSKIGGIQWSKIQKIPGLGTDNYGQAIRQQTETAYSGAYEVKVMQDKFVVTVLFGGADRPAGTEINNTGAVLMPLPEAAAGAKEMAAGLLGTL
ncbi:hypothetical protein GT755_06545 [Herbidospora sp. NEAU-GS84]|uniref:Uncharacterized protein n=1 Tax=Herbidospora solisilvae TaxID=2696284 RepID=A0A7C9J0Y0_9ACTN|nr:hypothetical protein [Herbidospora solisilvae]NAS21342.1 hypothetical protein [Herbidospora solisilvae]